MRRLLVYKTHECYVNISTINQSDPSYKPTWLWMGHQLVGLFHHQTCGGIIDVIGLLDGLQGLQSEAKGSLFDGRWWASDQCPDDCLIDGLGHQRPCSLAAAFAFLLGFGWAAIPLVGKLMGQSQNCNGWVWKHLVIICGKIFAQWGLASMGQGPSWLFEQSVYSRWWPWRYLANLNPDFCQSKLHWRIMNRTWPKSTHHQCVHPNVNKTTWSTRSPYMISIPMKSPQISPLYPP